ncbi:MAG TPA: NifB/NifX family molybdenum-iron cluster-binding protein [Acidimicrobiales bacterium]|nr:NifB/NifX family molybdenum-iron cluster-binding protein [Acidimicrobiales bacterium]
MIVCVPVDASGAVDPRWGRAGRVAIATVEDGEIREWNEVDVGWDALHDEGSEAAHHARVARFLRQHGVEVVVAHHMGAGMTKMLATMGVALEDGAEGDARAAVVSARRAHSGE